MLRCNMGEASGCCTWPPTGDPNGPIGNGICPGNPKGENGGTGEAIPAGENGGIIGIPGICMPGGGCGGCGGIIIPLGIWNWPGIGGKPIESGGAGDNSCGAVGISIPGGGNGGGTGAATLAFGAVALPGVCGAARAVRCPGR